MAHESHADTFRRLRAELEKEPEAPPDVRSLCPHCNGTEYRIVTKDGRQQAVECECRAVVKLERMLQRAGLPTRYQQASFESFTAKGVSAQVRAGLLLARRYVEEFPTLEPGSKRGLIFYGPCGTGKTHLCIAIARELVTRYSTRVYFTDFRELLKRIQKTFDSKGGETRDEVLAPVKQAPLVILDELGAARATDWTFEIVEEIINVRYNEDRATLITTNLPNLGPGESLQSRRGVGEYAAIAAQAVAIETLGDRVGERMFSRVQEMCRAVEMAGDDWRRKQK